jgi:hypothetical protein
MNGGSGNSSSSCRMSATPGRPSSSKAGVDDGEAVEGQLLLLDVGCDWVLADPCKLLR